MKRPLTVCLPLVWCVVCLVGFEHPGDEYAGWYFGSFAGSWITAFVDFGDPRAAIVPVAVTGGVVMALAGFLLEFLRISVREMAMLWILSLTVGAILVLAVIDLRHTSLPDVMINGVNLALYPAVFLAAVVGVIRRRSPAETARP
jgi:hypothetical protein